MKKSLLIALLLIVARASAGETVAQMPNVLGQLEAVDATGKKIGLVTSPDSIASGRGASVTLESNGMFFILDMTRDRLFAKGSALFYKSSDCTGIPYISQPGALYTPVSSSPPGNTIVVGDSSAVPIALAWSSIKILDSCGHQSPPAIQTGLVPAVPLFDASTLFPPPYKIVPRVVISDVSPNKVTGGGATIKIIGSGFSVGSAGVTFNGIPGSNIQVINDSLILVTVPGGLPVGPVTIGVTTAGGGSATLPGGAAGFSIGAETVAIPTLTQWGLILMGLCLLGAGIYFLKRRPNYSVS